MYREVSKLILYGAKAKGSILLNLVEIFKRFDQEDKATLDKEALRADLYKEINRLLVLATEYGFDDNLWHNYLTFLLITDENPFSITCEKIGAVDGTVNEFAYNDFRVFRMLYAFDFNDIETGLCCTCFSTISSYKAIRKSEFKYNRSVAEKTKQLSLELAACKSDEDFFNKVTSFYADYGVGIFGLNKAFRLEEDKKIVPINNCQEVYLKDLLGYEEQKELLESNTKAFVEGKKANNCLLYGDSGTGKSTSIKAIVNEFYPSGLRMIEINKYQFRDLPSLISQIKNRNYKFIIYMDDLSFEENETEYKYLKAVIEGGVETKPDNILIYATSNRRHLIRETWKDKEDMETSAGLHRSDTVEEKMSLFNRFGLAINYSKPTPRAYLDIVYYLADVNNIDIDKEELKIEANKWSIRHGGLSGRTAQQFINSLLSKE